MVVGVLKKNPPELCLSVLPLATQKAFLELSQKASWLKKNSWYLAGGTALALQAGHRSSVDLDFFTTRKSFNESELENILLALGNWRTDRIDRGTIYGVFRNAKVSLIAYPFFKPSKNKLRFQNINILKPDDIAVMKIVAVGQRGRKRDFIDLFWYCNNLGDLQETISRMLKQYPQEHSITHILKSLTYFDDAEKDPMPNLNFSATWPQVKSYFRREVPRLTKKLLHLD